MGLTASDKGRENITDYIPTKRGRNYRLATKKLTEIYRQPTKVENFNRQPTK